MKFFCVFLVVFLLIFVFVLPVSAADEMYMLSYTEWLSYYGLEHSDLNLVEWQSQFDGSNISSDYPIYIGVDEYNAWYSANPADSSRSSFFSGRSSPLRIMLFSLLILFLLSKLSIYIHSRRVL